MMKRTGFRSFRLAAVAALFLTAVGLAALCPEKSHAAGYLATKNPDLTITLLEGDRIPTIGVGESMLPKSGSSCLKWASTNKPG